MHPGPENPFSPTGWQQAQSFREELHQHFAGTITFRTSRGLDIEAACGQLVTQTKVSPKNENFLGFADKLGHDRLVEEKA